MMLFSLRQSAQLGRIVVRQQKARTFASFSWSTCDPETLNGNNPCTLENLVDGKWVKTKKYADVVDPMNGEVFVKMPDTSVDEVEPFIQSLKSVPKSGMHNPLKNPERYNMYADICFKSAMMLRDPAVEDFFVRLIQRTMPKSHAQATAEVRVSRTFLETFAGDGVRFMARSFAVSGDHAGQESKGYRWPFGPVAIVCPFNFPFEIPLLQLMGALFMGNKPVIKGAPATSLVLEQYIRLLHECGMPKEDVLMVHGFGEPMQKIITDTPVKVTQFTGSSTIAEKLLQLTNGAVKVEDAGFDWKIIGPDVGSKEIDYVSWVCDQDAYACSGQKCSAQSICFIHENAMKAGLVDKMENLAARRKLEDLTIGPVLSWTTENMLQHKDALLALPGAKLLFGGEPLDPSTHSIPKQYGAIKPTAVFVPLDVMLQSKENFELCTREIFGPFQVVTEYNDAQVDNVLDACERMSHHLTAAVVSSDEAFQHRILSNTVNGTTYSGIRARTTGAPANHWFGPAGNPNGAGIGSPEAIRLVWSCHREIIKDILPPTSDWTTPKAT